MNGHIEVNVYTLLKPQFFFDDIYGIEHEIMAFILKATPHYVFEPRVLTLTMTPPTRSTSYRRFYFSCVQFIELPGLSLARNKRQHCA